MRLAPITREQAQDMADAHGLHIPPDGLPREGCPECENRPLSSYPRAKDRDTNLAVLREVEEMGPATVAAIADGLGLPQGRVRRALWRLEAAGYVESDNYQRRGRVYSSTGMAP